MSFVMAMKETTGLPAGSRKARQYESQCGQPLSSATLATIYNLLVETSSSITWVGAIEATENSVDTEQPVEVTVNYHSRTIGQHLVGIFFQPDTRLCPIPAILLFWSIDQGITYSTTTISYTTAGIVNTGSTLIYIASDSCIYQATGAPCSNLGFYIDGEIFNLIPNAQTWLHSVNTGLDGGVDGVIYLIMTSALAQGLSLSMATHFSNASTVRSRAPAAASVLPVAVH
ncbi:hypothetical protein BDR04DRAFT_1153255 [Suillus decipiens]|nr:hypothetical protein BDR04DRAFT_1153255 [Suillus decipiens]